MLHIIVCGIPVINDSFFDVREKTIPGVLNALTGFVEILFLCIVERCGRLFTEVYIR